jgi:alkaline phosphatase D
MPGTSIGRRRFMATLTAGAAAFGRAPAIVQQNRPTIPFGVSSGDVNGDRALVWSRCDRLARMRVEWSTTEAFANVQRVIAPSAIARPEVGMTARVDLGNLPTGQTIFYRVRFEDFRDAKTLSEPVTGAFRTPPARIGGDVTLAWSADVVGQGWGINREWGGLRMFDTIRRAQPDVFVHCGDTIYADGPLAPEVKLPDGSTWRNLVTPAKSKVAETLDEFRGNHLYNLQDEHVRAFNAAVSQIVLWDDHEVKNNWFPGMSLADDKRYTIKDLATLVRNGRQAWAEHVPIRVASSLRNIYRSFSRGPLLDVFALDLRSYRAPNSPNRQPAPGPETQLAGAVQIEWLKRELVASRAVWKVIASDLPIGLLVRDGASNFEAVANGNGPPLGREHEIADLLRFINRARITNVVWITADVHYTAAHHYDPARARFKEFAPFWEFVSGPMHADTGPQAVLDDTFGPQVRFVKAAPAGTYVGPSAGLQFFGFITIRGATRVMTVNLRDLNGDTIYSVDLEPTASA